MALYKATIAGQLSGRIGAHVFSHNAGGQYVRIGTIPTNPNSPQQQVVRNAVAQLSNEWNNALTEPERLNWDIYAANTKLTNRIGEQINVSGLAMFVRSNVIRIQGSQAIVNNGPGVFNLGSHTQPTISNASEATQTVDFNFGASIFDNAWANQVGGFMFVFLSRPQNPTVNYFRNPYRQSGGVTGDPVPPVSPAALAVPFPIIAGQKLFGRAVSVLADGRASTPSFFETLTVA